MRIIVSTTFAAWEAPDVEQIDDVIMRLRPSDRPDGRRGDGGEQIRQIEAGDVLQPQDSGGHGGLPMHRIDRDGDEAVSAASRYARALLRALALSSMVVVVAQATTAGLAMLVDPAFAQWHALGGKLGSIVVVATAFVAWIWSRDRASRRLALLLLVAYHLQAAWLIVGQLEGFHWVRALHVPNALLVFHVAWRLCDRVWTRR